MLHVEAAEELSARAPDGEWWFAYGRLHTREAEVEPYTIDFFERWTFARFLPDGQLALGFESGQPWSEHGSYGDRYGGVQVLARTGPTTWSLVAIEFDRRDFDERFVPTDVAWHRRGVLAWLREGTLYVQVLAAPRGRIAFESLPPRDSDLPVELVVEASGRWRRLQLDATGRMLTATDEWGSDVFDLVLQRRARDGGPWRPIDA